MGIERKLDHKTSSDYFIPKTTVLFAHTALHCELSFLQHTYVLFTSRQNRKYIKRIYILLTTYVVFWEIMR